MNETPRTPMTLTDISKVTDSGDAMPTGGPCGCCAPQPTIAVPPTIEGAVTAEHLVEGLTCTSCATRVSSVIGALAGVEDVRIALVPGGTSTVSIASSRPLSRTSVRDAVHEAGYRLVPA